MAGGEIGIAGNLSGRAARDGGDENADAAFSGVGGG